MEKICPACNAIYDVVEKCERCGGVMTARQRTQEFMGEYGEKQDIKDTPNECTHIFVCDKCKSLNSEMVNKVQI